MARFQQGARVENIQVLCLKEEKKPLSNKKKNAFSLKKKDRMRQSHSFRTSSLQFSTSLGHPKIEKGKMPDENQVSRTSSSVTGTEPIETLKSLSNL